MFSVDALAAAGLAVLVPTRPGYPGTPTWVGETAEAAADSLAALLSALEIDRVAVLGVSAGGPTALHLCARHPSRVTRLALACAVTKTWVERSDPQYRLMRRLFGRGQAALWAALRGLVAIAPRRVARSMLAPLCAAPIDEVMARLDARDLEAIRQLILRQSSGRGFLLDLEHRVAPAVLEELRAPTLIVHSRRDASVPFAHAEHARAHIKGATIVEAPTLGHLLWVGPGRDVVDRELIEFFRGSSV